MPPARPGDVKEEHLYHFGNPKFRLEQIAPDPGTAGWRAGKNAVIVNEYGWLWLNRDGTPTTLTKDLYRNLLGPHSTTAERRHLYARYLAAETEFWRAHRSCAAVMHFCAGLLAVGRKTAARGRRYERPLGRRGKTRLGP